MSIFNFVKSRLLILDVVSEYIQLKQAGGYWKGKCPFHAETDASFTVSPDKQIYYCFGCHSGGDIISFIAKTENLSQIEATQHLVEKYKLEIPEELKKQTGNNNKSISEKERFFLTNKTVASWMHKKLISNNTALDYLKKRTIPQNIIRSFEIGYLPSGTRSINIFIKEMSQSNILLKDLMEAGILMEGRTGIYSPFEERIIFPIKDTIGRNCGFGGRIFQPNDQRAKYYNSKESELFIKGKLLFGLDKAKKEMQQKSFAFLVEGYTDSIAMHQYGYMNTVATLGTACTIHHLQLLSRQITKLYVLYDGDAAGQKAILRLTELCWKANLELFIITLPKEDDPETYLKKGNDLSLKLETASDIFTFFVESTSSNFWQKSLSEKLKICGQLISLITNIDDQLKQEILLQKMAHLTQIPFDSLKNIFKQQQENKGTIVIDNPQIIKANDSSFTMPPTEAKILAAIINSQNDEEPIKIDPDIISYFSSEFHKILKNLDTFGDKKNKTIFEFNGFLEILDDNEQEWLLKNSFLFDKTVSKNVFNQLIFHFQKQNWKQIVQNIKISIFKARQKNDTQKLSELLGTFSKLKQNMKNKGII
jgi:DNA primase